MAGGIDWFRWHHGSVTDPKFQLVARKAGARLGDVVTVWAFLLEKASQDADRGAFGELDLETLDFLLGAEDGTAARIVDAMSARGLVADGRVVAWEKRQPKRERESDDTAAERKRNQRARDAAKGNQDAPGDASEDQPEPGHAASRHVTPRGEERREEEISEGAKAPSSSAGADPPTRKGTPTIPCPYAEIVEAYHDRLPALPKVRLTDGKTWTARQKAMRSVWGWVLSSKRSDGTRRAENGEQALQWLRDYFARAAENDFLMGRTDRGPAHANWRCDLDFLLTDKGMKHVIEKTEEAAA